MYWLLSKMGFYRDNLSAIIYYGLYRYRLNSFDLSIIGIAQSFFEIIDYRYHFIIAYKKVYCAHHWIPGPDLPIG